MDDNLVFLGGTCGNSKWREPFIKALVDRGASPGQLFNPVVPDWNDDAKIAEERAKAEARFHVYYLTDPEQGGVFSTYSLVEAVLALVDRRRSTVIVFDLAGMTHMTLDHQKAMLASFRALRDRFSDALIFDSAAAAIDALAAKLQLAPVAQ